ncbi:hypothetical protein FTUN_8452 [Frigoriglobus tundricola]|uniref:Uncharacterized protein n=1 Tax=Frigoriglobus tundricola TaxID=2774151 RepID=A0A6M5Z5X5_9BACT|nr:hypothetical protein FTUN_8452 [Frigoriglobus tundricola]
MLGVIRELARKNDRSMEQEIKAGLIEIANARKAQPISRSGPRPGPGRPMSDCWPSSQAEPTNGSPVRNHDSTTANHHTGSTA